MNAVEIEQAVSELAELPFDAEEFPFAFLAAFGNKATTIKRLRTGATNKSDLGGVLMTNNVHLKVCAAGLVGDTLGELRESRATGKGKVKFILATDGDTFEAEDLNSGETVVCDYQKFPDHFGFFLSLAGISTVKQIRENAFDIKATGRLNRLYVQLLKDNPGWGTGEQREQMNHFMARLIFCFFAEDTDIFLRPDLFTDTIDRMSDSDASNTHEIIMELFRAMNTKHEDRQAEKIARWADELPYVNGGLFEGSLEVPRFTRIARSYLLHIGGLDWKKVNPDIFGSMIQAVADDEERGELGMHYTSVPNILKVLNPLFLDDLREQLEFAGDNGRKLLNLRSRLAKIRVFDPACGSGNFLVIAYKEMRAIEAVVNQRRGESDQRSVIPVTNFRGIEIRDFSAEVARLALIIAEYQCDVLYRGQKDAIQDFLPLRVENWITCANALQIDWLSVCSGRGINVQHRSSDLFFKAESRKQVNFENEGGEVYICGNPPYLGSRKQTKETKSELEDIASKYERKWKSLDYSSAWIFRAKEFQQVQPCRYAFVTTSSLCEGLHVSILWKHILEDCEIYFAHRPFKWANLAKGNAGVSVVVVGVSKMKTHSTKRIFSGNEQILATNINAYLADSKNIYVETRNHHISGLNPMVTGAMPRDGGHLILSHQEFLEITQNYPCAQKFLRRYMGSEELINGKIRFCIWAGESNLETCYKIPEFEERFTQVKNSRRKSPLKSTRDFAEQPHRFVYLAGKSERQTIAIGAVSSEWRPYLPVDIMPPSFVCSNRVYAIYDGRPSDLAILSSKLHLAWVIAISGRLEQRISYSNTLCWNTFPVPTLTEKNKADLTRCAENILLAREAHFPKTIADLYDPEKMPPNLREAHEQNDETLERIYIGRRFKNDTERLEKLFELYNKMTSSPQKLA